MEKIYGAKSEQNGLYRVGRMKWEVIFGFGKDNESDESGYNYRVRYSYRPRLENIKKDIFETIDHIVGEKILHGMTFQGHQVWLSAEKQKDYSDWYNLIHISEEHLPVKVMLGETENPVEITFNTVEEYTEFYEAVTIHIRDAVYEGWNMKSNINWEDYVNEKD